MSRKSTPDADGHPTYAHRHKYTDPSHHVGPSTPAMRAGRALHHHRRSGEHLHSAAVKRKFIRRYGKRKGEKIYGAVVGERSRLKRRSRR
jgi:hypothetical protein